MASEKYSNNAATTLNGAIDNAVTTIVVAGFTGFPSTAQYRVIIDGEIMIVTAGAGTTSWTVTRGAEGTAAAAHLTAAPVTQILTKGALDQIIADNCQYGVIGSLPAAEKAGRLYLTSDAIYGYRDNGSSWDAFGFRALTPPVLGSFTQVNFKSAGQLAVASQTHGGIFLYGPADTADSFSMLMKAIPATPYSCIFNLEGIIAGVDYSSFGVIWRNTGNAFLKGIYQDFEGEFYAGPPATGAYMLGVAKGTDGSPHLTANYTQLPRAQAFSWFRLRDDNTNQIYSVSVDGFNWHDLYSQARNTDVTPDTVGFFVNPRNASSRAASAVLRSYQETA